MTRISRSVHIDASAEEVWQAPGEDFGRVSKLTSEGAVGVGATRHCKLSMMNATLDERISD